MTDKIDLYGLNAEELKLLIVSLGQPAYRAKQVLSWTMKGTPIDGMLNVPAPLREKLKETCFSAVANIAQKKVSSDGTVKYLFEMYDSEKIESVLMKYKYGNTVCLSTEAGCPMGCAFCASTIGGLKRRLYPSEMLAQVLAVEKDSGERVSNIVLMGIGEPLDNYDNVIKFLHLVNSPDGPNIGYRHISLSTCGLADKIYKLADEALPITLSISLHAPDDVTRSSIMPVNNRYNIETLLTACRDYFKKTGRRISFEYTLVKGKNDNVSNAVALCGTLRKYCPDMPLHVNLIPVNNVTERGFLPPSKENVDEFAAILEKKGIIATVRRHLGSDIDASCGQLRASKNKPQ